MKILLVLIFTCLFFSDSFSQVPVFALPANTFIMNGVQGFVKVQNGYLGIRKYFSIHKNIHKPHLNRLNVSVVNYDDRMVELSENKFSDGEFVYGMLEPQIVKGKKIWVICADPAKWIQPGNIKAVEIDPQTYKPGVSKIIFSQEELDEENGTFENFKLMIKSSPNAKYHCLYFGKGEDKKFYMACLNSDFEPVWKEKIQIPETNTDQVSDMSINDNGEILLTSITKSVASISIYTINGGVTHKSIDFGNVEPTFIDILESKSGNIYIGGTAKKDSKLKNVVFLAKLEKDYTLSNMKQFDIADNILDRLAKDGLAKTDYKKTGLTGNNIHSQLVEQNDGKIKLITETTYGDNDSNSFMGFGGLIITDFNKTTDQFSLIPKFMVEVDAWIRVNQFVAAPSTNSITVIYCDNEENINLDLKERQKPLNGRAVSALYAATIDNDGIVKRKIIATKTGKDDYRTTAQLIQAYIANKQ
jgi:hypothetical protein